MALEPGYTYSNSVVTASAADGKTSVSAPLFDISRTATATGTATALPAEACQGVTIINSSGNTLFVSSNSGSALSIPANSGFSFNIFNTSQLQISGSGAIGYTVSK
jgi:uncharacterized protein YaiE (UPF0345 family)